MTLTAAREVIYAKADVIVDSAADLSVDQMAHRVEQALAARADVLDKDL